MFVTLAFASWLLASGVVPAALEAARDAQDRSALERLAGEAGAAASRQPDDAKAQHESAVAHLYLAEVALELRDKELAKNAAETGIGAAQRSVALNGSSSEYRRVLGTLCGQVIPANVWAGLKYGRCALDEITKAIELDPKSAMAHVSRGVGNYYLPPTFGGGVEPAVRDFRKAIELDPKLAEAHMWLGIALRKGGQNAEARAALTKAVQLNPRRAWAKQQLEKTPPK
jgi:tetratricopeptide (TPR) repeat protein